MYIYTKFLCTFSQIQNSVIGLLITWYQSNIEYCSKVLSKFSDQYSESIEHVEISECFFVSHQLTSEPCFYLIEYSDLQVSVEIMAKNL